MLSRYFLDFSVGVGAFVMGLSQISSCFSYGSIHMFRYSSLISDLTLNQVLFKFKCETTVSFCVMLDSDSPFLNDMELIWNVLEKVNVPN